jgi:hypothetical protein
MSLKEEFEEFDVGEVEGESIKEEGVSEVEAASEELLSVRDQLVEQLLMGEAAEKAFAAEAGTDLIGFENIMGVGGPAYRVVDGNETDELAVVVYVAEKLHKDQIDPDAFIPESIDGVPVDVVATGEIYAQPNKGRYRPAPGGVSVGHVKVTAGTIGCLVTKNKKLYILSNNHVLSPCNNAKPGDAIVQPGPIDGGKDPQDRIALLSEFKPINFGGVAVNYIDAAIAQTTPRLVTSLNKCFGKISASPIPCKLNLLVKKCGRTTQLTKGRITDCNATVKVNYTSCNKVALFKNQITVRSLTSMSFSAGGDSGSLVVTQEGNRPVGLLFAGGDGFTFANPITRVLSALKVTIVA